MDFMELVVRNPHEARKEARKKAAPKKDDTLERRKAFVEGCDKALASLKSKDLTPKRGWYVCEDGGVTVKPKVGRNIMRIYASGEGQDKFDFIPNEDPLTAATAFFRDLKEKAASGKIDSWFAATLAGETVPKKQGGKPKLDD